MRITGYTYRADYHCPYCAKVDRDSGALEVNNHHPHAVKPASDPSLDYDQHGLHYNLVDCEGNLIKPVFDIDEKLETTHCRDCCREII